MPRSHIAGRSAWHHVAGPKEVILATTVNEQPEGVPEDDLSFDELARRQGVKPITSIGDLAQPDLWESDAEYDEFLDDLYASRRAGMA